MTPAPKPQAPAPQVQFDLGLFGHARDLLELHEVANALRISDQQVRDLVDSGAFMAIGIGDDPAAKRRHLRVKRFTVEAWYLEREQAENGLNLPYRVTPEIRFWREHLRAHHLSPQGPSEAEKRRAGEPGKRR